MIIQHKKLKDGKWYELDLIQQLANIGSEVLRAINWRIKKNDEYSQMAFFRALELLDLTISDPKNRNKLKEIARVREVLVDYFSGSNLYRSSDKLWEHYFLPFNFAARNLIKFL